MKEIAISCCLAAFVWVAGGCAAQVPTEGQAGSAQAGDTQLLNQPVNAGMTCAEFKALVKSGDKSTTGVAVLWLDGYYSAVLGSANCPPAGPARLVRASAGPAQSA
jgi:hypothetical protein